MPLTSKGKEIMSNMKKEYGNRANKVFYASRNKGTIRGVDKNYHKKKRALIEKAQ